MAADRITGLVEVFVEELRLCGVGPGDTVGVITQGMKRSAYAEDFQRAAGEIGAAAFHVDIPADGAPDDGGELGVRAADTGLSSFNDVLVETFSRCDLMVDLVFMLWSQEQHRIRGAGTRIISCVEPPEVLRRLFPTADLRRRVLAARELLEGAATLRISDDAGTDAIWELGEFDHIHQYGMADEPGRWDHFASALVGTVGNSGGVRGTVVLKPGDILFPHSRFLSAPVSLTLADGRVTAIEGGFEAELVRDYLARYDDEDAYAVSHIGWGMNERARWDALSIGGWEYERTRTHGIGMDSRSFLGSVMFSTGPNVEFGGDNNTPCHMDMPMRGCSLWLDDEQVIDHGSILPVQLRATSARESAGV